MISHSTPLKITWLILKTSRPNIWVETNKQTESSNLFPEEEEQHFKLSFNF